ncbi:MAG: TrkA family potassium uptake protein [Candidatus Diapherotrites archaeon]|nr:TrkA family potassium uptake protein [Candidatus Diapherotrites archaeon]
MYIVIVGATKLAYYLAKLLLEEGHDALVIDKDEEKCKKFSDELNIVAVHGDATNPRVLEEANVKEADAVVMLSGVDETNMVVSLLAKQLGAKKVVASISKLEYDEKILQKIGIDIVVHPEAAAAAYLEELITKPGVLDLAFLSRGDAEIMEIDIKDGMKIVGKKLKDIKMPEGSAIVGIYEGNTIKIPKSGTEIKPNQRLLVLVKREKAGEVSKLFS